jgi:hypothetical protein
MAEQSQQLAIRTSWQNTLKLMLAALAGCLQAEPTGRFLVQGLLQIAAVSSAFPYMCSALTCQHNITITTLLLLLCRDTGLWLSLGGFQETGPDPNHL